MRYEIKACSHQQCADQTCHQLLTLHVGLHNVYAIPTLQLYFGHARWCMLAIELMIQGLCSFWHGTGEETCVLAC